MARRNSGLHSFSITPFCSWVSCLKCGINGPRAVKGHWKLGENGRFGGFFLVAISWKWENKVHQKGKKKTQTPTPVCFISSLLDIMTELVPFYNCLSLELGRLQKAKTREKAASNYENQPHHLASSRSSKHKLSNIYLYIELKGYRLMTIRFCYYVTSKATITTSLNHYFSNNKE